MHYFLLHFTSILQELCKYRFLWLFLLVLLQFCFFFFLFLYALYCSDCIFCRQHDRTTLLLLQAPSRSGTGRVATKAIYNLAKAKVETQRWEKREFFFFCQFPVFYGVKAVCDAVEKHHKTLYWPVAFLATQGLFSLQRYCSTKNYCTVGMRKRQRAGRNTGAAAVMSPPIGDLVIL